MDVHILQNHFKICNKSRSGLAWTVAFITGHGEVIRVGDPAGKLNRHKYWTVWLNGRGYLVHRIIFLLHHGKLTDGLVIDHINRIRHDNRIENLRELSIGDNARNRGPWGESKRLNQIIRTNRDEFRVVK